VSKEDGSYFEIIAFGDNRADLSIEVKKWKQCQIKL
jgi:hypothetical protein